MSRRVEMPPNKPSRRVAAWIYAVINPIIDSLQKELLVLDSRNLTWRAYLRRCEMLKPIQEYVDSTQWPNYQTFLAEHPKSVFIAAFKRHDSALLALNNAAQSLFDRLLTWGDFLDAIHVASKNYESQRGSLGPRAQPLTDMGDDVRKEVAQHVINNVQLLPSHYVISPFWNSAGMNLLTFRNRPEFQPLNRATDNLIENTARVKQALESYRLSLSRDYDVPAAPVPGLSFEE